MIFYTLITQIRANAFVEVESVTSITILCTLSNNSFNLEAFDSVVDGNIRSLYLAAGGGIGTYTRPNVSSLIWTKQTP